MIKMSKTVGVSVNDDDIMLCGYQRKLKTMKKKYFVLYKKSQHFSARLEYFDNEKKFRTKVAPKRVIELKNCFNINRRLDTKYDYVIALSTRDGGFGIVLETEDDMRKWLEILINLQRYEANTTENNQQYFEHVWQVQVQRKGLAEDKGILGHYHVGLTAKSLTFIRIGSEKNSNGENRKTNIEFLLTTIRRCGDSQCYFYMEVGRQSITGPGELWMETEDSLIAQNMHHMILNAMSAKTDSNIEPMRKRSSSANEASKPINVLHRRQIQTENKINNSPQSIQNFVRERCDSLPSRNRIPSESSNQSSISIQNFRNTSGHRVHSLQRHSNSPPMSSTTVCSESEESSVSIEDQDDNSCMFAYRFHSRSSEGVIPEENTDEVINSENKSHDLNCKIDFGFSQNTGDNYVSMAPVKNNSSVVENKMNNLKQKLFLVDAKTFSPSTGCQNRELYKSAIEFTEFTSDRLPKSQLIEIETQIDRPARTFSIGSRIEHNRLNQRFNNTVENDNNCRVRAFSVGSRAKIPRCDLQKCVLFSKNIEQNFNSNNNIYGPNNQVIGNLPSREKKSTSAPILLNKSHNCVDLMGDLMEIDFSKNIHLQNQRGLMKPPILKSLVHNIREKNNDLCFDDENRTDTIKLQLDNSASETDNGYLEMKPVGNILSNTTKTVAATSPSVEYDQSSVVSKKDSNCMIVVNESNDNEPAIKSQTKFSYEKTYPGKKETRDHLRDKQTKNISLLAEKICELNLTSLCEFETKKRNVNADCVPFDKFVINEKDNKLIANDNNITTSRLGNKKLIHSVSDDNYETSELNKQNKKSGYEILQNKSDSSLESVKSVHRSPSLEKDLQKFQLADKLKFSNLNVLNASSVHQMGKDPIPISPISKIKQSNIKCCQTTVASSDSITRPHSLNSDHKLYYASLDLPPCGTDMKGVTTKDIHQTFSSPINSPSQTPTPSVNNLYAKIDFEYSDASVSTNQANA